MKLALKNLYRKTAVLSSEIGSERRGTACSSCVWLARGSAATGDTEGRQLCVTGTHTRPPAWLALLLLQAADYLLSWQHLAGHFARALQKK